MRSPAQLPSPARPSSGVSRVALNVGIGLGAAVAASAIALLRAFEPALPAAVRSIPQPDARPSGGDASAGR